MDATRDELTPREVEILRLLARGMSHKQAAGELGIAKATVSNHVQVILQKLRAHNIAEAVVIGLRRGLLSDAVVDD